MMKLVDILDEIDRIYVCYENMKKRSRTEKETKIESCLDNYNNTNHSFVYMNYD
jgi:hypothetical protein